VSPWAKLKPTGPAVGAICFVVALGHLTLFPKVADLDGFYHIGHAAAYLEGSVFDTTFPWATQSAIRDEGADLWWGFHVVLTPFAAFEDPAVGMRLAAIMLTLLIGLTVLVVLRRHGVPEAGWWAAAFLIAVPNIFFRYLMVRPHVLSLAVSMALLSVLVRGRWWHVALLSALISWLHLSLFWVGPGLVVAYAMTRIPVTIASEPGDPDHGVPIRLALAAAVVGTLAGWLLRPNPLGTASLLSVQLIRLFALKATEEPLLFATELLPIGLPELLRSTWLFSGLWLVAVVAAGHHALKGIATKLDHERATFLIAATVVSIAFLGLALISARRAMEQWVAFGFLTLPFAWSFVVGAKYKLRARPALIALVAIHFAWGGWRHMLNVEHAGFAGDSLSEVATFLEANSAPGEVVFHAHWDNFGPLFAHNRTNHYLGGMDPIFQFAHDPKSYWEYFYLSADISAEWTCDAFPCALGVATDSHRVIRDHFGARWVLVEPRRNPRFTLELLNDDARYELALETQREALFRVLLDTTSVGN